MKPTPAEKRVTNKVFIMIVIAAVVLAATAFLMGWSPNLSMRGATELPAAVSSVA